MPNSRPRPRLVNVERWFVGRLRKVGRNIGKIIADFGPIDMDDVPDLSLLLADYGETLREWATLVSRRMVTAADKQDRAYWRQISKEMSQEMQNVLRDADIRPVMEQTIHEQVELITTLPRTAAERVGRLTQEALITGVRAADIAEEIQRSGEVSEAEATRIARTEVARTASKLTQARSLIAGATEYIWRTTGDSDVRKGHRAMAGKVCRWDTPPAVDEGSPGHPRIVHHHPGEIWNCRCYPEPILPE